VAIRVEFARTVAALGNITTGIIQAPLAPEFVPLNLRA
jgi:hypothetical protein